MRAASPHPGLRLARAAEARARFAEANAIFERAEAHVMIGRCFELEEAFDRATAAWERAVELDPRSPGARTALAKLIVKEACALRGLPAIVVTESEVRIGDLPEESPEAREACRRAEAGLAAAGESDELREGLRFFCSGSWAEAAEILERHFDKHRWEAVVAELRARAWQSSRDAEERKKAVPDLLKDIELAPRDPLAYVWLSRVYRRAGAAQADADATRVLAERPDHLPSLIARAIARYSAGDHEGSIIGFTRLIEMDGTRAAFWYFRAHNLLALRQYADATRAIELDGRFPDPRLVRSLARSGKGGQKVDDLGKYEESGRETKGSIEYGFLSPGPVCVVYESKKFRAAYEVQARENRAVLTLITWVGPVRVHAWPEGAAADDVKGRILRLEEARAPFVRGIEYLESESPEWAAEEFERAWELVPEHGGALQNAAICRFRLAAKDPWHRMRALELAEALLQLDPRNFAALKIAGLTYLRARRFADAHRCLSGAQAVRPADKDVAAALTAMRASGQERLKELEKGTWKEYAYVAWGESAPPGDAPAGLARHVFEIAFTRQGRHAFTLGLTPHGKGRVLELSRLDGAVEALGTYGDRVPSFEELKQDAWKALEVLASKDALAKEPKKPAVPERKTDSTPSRTTDSPIDLVGTRWKSQDGGKAYDFEFGPDGKLSDACSAGCTWKAVPGGVEICHKKAKELGTFVDANTIRMEGVLGRQYVLVRVPASSADSSDLADTTWRLETTMTGSKPVGVVFHRNGLMGVPELTACAWKPTSDGVEFWLNNGFAHCVGKRVDAKTIRGKAKTKLGREWEFTLSRLN